MHARISRRLQKKNNKRTPNYQSPSKINFKKARYECLYHSDDSHMGNGIGFEDLPITNLDTCTEQGTLNQQDAPTEKLMYPYMKHLVQQ